MKKFRLLSALLAFLMLLGCLTVLPVSAAETEDGEEEEEEDSGATIDYMNAVLQTADEKLETMTERVTSKDGRYSLYVDEYSGEVAWHDNLVNQTLFTNPYNLNSVSKSSSADVKAKLMSQVLIKFNDGGKEVTYNSYTEAAQRKQIKVKNIKNGLRVEYSIGREETRKLVPKMIERSRYETLIYANIQDNEFMKKKFDAFYSLKDPDDPTLTDRGVKEMMMTWKITQRMAVYVFDPQATDRELNMIERFIIDNCPQYNYDELERDHEITEYVGTDRAPALFKMALEYYMEDGTLRVRFPVNGLRFDETQYQLINIQPLPYFGCGSYSYDGFLFLPDGSGTLVRFEDFKNASGKTVTTAVYGQDYAFYEISGEHQEVCRLPVYGIVENVSGTVLQTVEKEVEPWTDADGVLHENETEKVEVEKDIREDKGFFAVIEEGEALAKITAETGGRTSNFDTVYTAITPRQRDSYNISEAVSGAGSAMLNVISKRKYTGNYTIRYTMLNDDTFAKDAGLTEKEYYPTSYVGMVDVYRDYLEKNNIITRMTKDDVKDDIPLYIEAFGAIEVQEKFLSFPVSVHTPLTTFEDLKLMTSRLNEVGITNINYKLTGFFNGGMKASVPYKVNVEDKLGGANGFKDFITYANEKGVGVYPEFDFAWADSTVNDIFTGLNNKKHIVRSMNTKYARLREYDPQYQEYGGTTYMAITPAYFEYFYNEFSKNYKKLNPIGISAASIGKYLNSDFDKTDPYNREDNKDYTKELFQMMKDEYGKVMTEGGNFYALSYATDVLNLPLDSSEYLNTSETIPFIGMVLHGYVNFAGMPMNRAGDINYQILKSIENGAACYFQLSYENTEKVKSDVDFQKYYSISFDIWFEDLVEAYKKLNDATRDLQTKLIVDHEFVEGERVLNEDELAQLKEEQERIREEQRAAEEAARLAEELAEQEEVIVRKNDEETDAEQTDENGAEENKQDTKTETEEKENEEEPEEEIDYAEISRTAVNNGKIVRVTYEGGVTFILNYNNFAVEVDGTEIPALGFVRK